MAHSSPKKKNLRTGPGGTPKCNQPEIRCNWRDSDFFSPARSELNFPHDRRPGSSFFIPLVPTVPSVGAACGRPSRLRFHPRDLHMGEWSGEQPTHGPHSFSTHARHFISHFKSIHISHLFCIVISSIIFLRCILIHLIKFPPPKAITYIF